MFLTARLFALVVYCILLFVFCIAIKTRHKKIILLFYILVLSIIGYLYIPYESADLYRLIQIMHIYSTLSFPDLLELIKTSATPLTILYFYLISFLGNDHFLPAINTFITFSFCFSILYGVSKKYRLKNSDTSLILFFFMSSGLLMPTITNLRTMLSLSIVAYCIYIYYFQKTSILKQIPLLIIAMLFHVSAVILSFIYLLYIAIINLFNARKIFNFILYCFIIIVFFIAGNFYLQKAYVKGQGYIQSTMEGTGYFYFWEMLICILVALFVLFIITFFIIKKPYIRQTLVINEKYFIIFMLFLSFLDLIFFKFEYNVGVRLNFAINILCIPLLSVVLSNKNMKHTVLKYSIALYSLLLLLLSCSRGSLCGLKFFE